MEYFQKKKTGGANLLNRKNSAELNEKSSSNREQEGRISLIDEKRIRMLEILLQKLKMTIGTNSDKMAVFAVKEAFLSCNYEIVPLDSLVIVRNVHNAHLELGEPVREFVEKHGEGRCFFKPKEGNKKEGPLLDHPYCHFLVSEVCCKIPALPERLDCMMFEGNFMELYETAFRKLELAYGALQVIVKRKSFCVKFFKAAKILGNQLNSGSSAQVFSDDEERGFELATLDKLNTVKSTSEPKCTLYHFVLGMLKLGPDAGEAHLFSSEDIKILEQAKLVTAAAVYENCDTLLTSLDDVSDLVKDPAKAERFRYNNESDDDHFLEKMATFLDSAHEQAEQVATFAWNVFTTYKELGIFFDDPGSIWPIPASGDAGSTYGKVDLFSIMCNFAVSVRNAWKDLTGDMIGLKNKIEGNFVKRNTQVALKTHSSVTGTFRSPGRIEDALRDTPQLSYPHSLANNRESLRDGNVSRKASSGRDTEGPSVIEDVGLEDKNSPAARESNANGTPEPAVSAQQAAEQHGTSDVEESFQTVGAVCRRYGLRTERQRHRRGRGIASNKRVRK